MNDIMTIKDVIDEDFVNYKKPSMFIATSRCTFKCEKEDCNVKCQNSSIALQPNIQVSIDSLIQRYLDNSITSAIVFGGLEPCDQLSDILKFIEKFRQVSQDDIVIYTGYLERELNYFRHNRKSFLSAILRVNRTFSNKDDSVNKIIIKFGRFKTSSDKRFDEILGVELASSNQYAQIYGIRDVI